MAYIMSAQNVTGTASAASGGYHAMTWSDAAYYSIACSGNPASATLIVSPDGAGSWMSASSFSLAQNSTATGQINAFYPVVGAVLFWVSGGTQTGTVTFQYVGRLAGAG